MEKCSKLGTAVAQSLGKPYEEVNTWEGEEGVCPVCHNSLLSVTGTTRVEWPICGIWGTLSVNGEKVSVAFSEEEKNRARNTTSRAASVSLLRNPHSTIMIGVGVFFNM